MINYDDKLGFSTYKSVTDTNLTIFTYTMDWIFLDF